MPNKADWYINLVYLFYLFILLQAVPILSLFDNGFSIQFIYFFAGSVPAMFIIENILEHVAKELALAPAEVRVKNLYKTGQVCKNIKYTYTYWISIVRWWTTPGIWLYIVFVDLKNDIGIWEWMFLDFGFIIWEKNVSVFPNGRIPPPSSGGRWWLLVYVRIALL